MRWLLILGLLCWPIKAATVFIDEEQIFGTKYGTEKTWDYNYFISFNGNDILVSLNLMLTGNLSLATPDVISFWENSIENTWYTNRFEVPIVVDVNFFTASSPDLPPINYEINVQSGFAETDMVNWSPAFIDFVDPTAHEVGHMFGLFDEFDGGEYRSASVEYRDTGGLMHMATGPTLDHYYDDFNNWYLQESQAPEPKIFAGVLIFLILALLQKNRKNNIRKKYSKEMSPIVH